MLKRSWWILDGDPRGASGFGGSTVTVPFNVGGELDSNMEVREILSDILRVGKHEWEGGGN